MAVMTNQRRNGRPQRENLRRQRRYGIIVFLFAFAAIGSLIMITEGSNSSARTPIDPGSTPSAQPGSIVRQSEAGCEQLIFDNATGKTIENYSPCDSHVILDAHGVPIPQGTMHHLNAISKSFSGH
jgi:hypothetical protein